MKYLCLAYYDAPKFGALSREELKALVSQCPPLDAELRATGKLHLQGSLGLPDTSASIRPKDGKPTMTDGPFIETKEQIGGVFIVEAESLAEAVAIASKHPAASLGEAVGWGIEVRPIEFLEDCSTKLGI